MVFHGLLPQALCLLFFCPPKHIHHWVYDLILRSLTRSTKIFIPNQVAFQDSRWTYLWGNHHSTHYLWAQQAPTLFPGTHAGISRVIRQITGKRAIQGSLRSVCSIHPAACPSVLPPRTYGELATWKEPMGLLPTTVAGGSVARRREPLPLRFCGKQRLLEKIVGHVAWFRLRVWCLHRPGLQSRKGNNPCKDSRQEVSSQRLVPPE